MLLSDDGVALFSGEALVSFKAQFEEPALHDIDIVYGVPASLRVVEIQVPPLRERTEDVQGLAQMLLTRVARQMHRPVTAYTPDALEQILRYPWPGNVRELENAVERACALATADVIGIDDLPDEVRHHHTLVIASEHVRPLRDIEREYILAALERNHGSKTVTAGQLRIGLATLRRKLKSYKKTG